MWKKEEEPTAKPVATPPAPQQRPRSGEGAEGAKIGRSIRIRGEVEGDEDLVIEGKVDGSVNLQHHSVTVGPEGEVRANINARVVTVNGKVTGNLTADEQVILSGTAEVEGDITAPRVVLEDGAAFRGGVDMGDHTRNDSPAAKGVSGKASTGGAEGSKAGSGTAAAGGSPESGKTSSARSEEGSNRGDTRPAKAPVAAGS